MIEEIQKESQAALHVVTETTFRKVFQQWKTRWDRCIAAHREYFEDDGNLGGLNFHLDVFNGGRGVSGNLLIAPYITHSMVQQYG